MHTFVSRGLALGGLLLSSLFHPGAMAAKPGSTHATGSAAEVLALSPAQVAALKADFASTPQQLAQRSGEQVYQSICQGCHMPKAQGSQGAGFYPALAANAKLTAAAYPVAVVMNGLHGMPGFGGRLSNQEVAEVVNYVRSHFGNRYTDAVSASDVQAFRP
ncbi:c-type cytochrome [Comamonas composti]|uniref:c-type cytochrome n=1 Tax=Comamonas composti TaxID=408558 RepID=UPI000423C349|nr:cytochrome c [Comamonas composti]